MTKLVCSQCGKLLYTTDRDLEIGDFPKAAEMRAAPGVQEAYIGMAVICPSCGSTGVNAILASGERVLLM